MTTLTPEQEAHDILARAKKLPQAYREAVANALLLDDAREMETDADRAELKAELTRRWERLRSGKDVGIPAAEVVAELFQRAEGYKRP